MVDRTATLSGMRITRGENQLSGQRAIVDLETGPIFEAAVGNGFVACSRRGERRSRLGAAR